MVSCYVTVWHMAQLFVVRHGQTVFNLSGRMQGSADSPLTDLGIEQARRAANALSGMGLSAAYASPLGRAVKTATEVLRPHPHVALNTDADLQELHFGIWEGKAVKDAFPLEHPSKFFVDLLYGDGQGMPGGESGFDFSTRIKRGFSRIGATHAEDEKVLVVSHGITIAAYLALSGLTEGDVSTPPNASITTLWVDGDGNAELEGAPTLPEDFAAALARPFC